MGLSWSQDTAQLARVKEMLPCPLHHNEMKLNGDLFLDWYNVAVGPAVFGPQPGLPHYVLHTPNAPVQ